MKTYKFNELPQDVQDKILEMEMNCDWEWYETCLDDFKESLKQYGITIDVKDISFSGFSNQGDGASFTTKHGGIDALKFVLNSGFNFNFERETYGLLEDMAGVSNLYEEATERFISLEIKRTDHRHVHENSVSTIVSDERWAGSGMDDLLEIDEFADEKLNVFVEKLEEHFESFVEEKCKELYRKLEQEYESMFGHSTVMKRLELCKWDEDYNLID